jgi:hypothetical protein
MSNIKSKGDRLKETITLLKKLPKVGVPMESYQYSQVQDLMTEWVNGGPGLTERLDFQTHWADIVLPENEGDVATLNMKLKNK